MAVVALQLQDNLDNTGNTHLEVVLDIEVGIVGNTEAGSIGVDIGEVALVVEVVELVEAWADLQQEQLLGLDMELELEEEDFGMEAVDIERMWGHRQFRERQELLVKNVGFVAFVPFCVDLEALQSEGRCSWLPFREEVDFVALLRVLHLRGVGIRCVGRRSRWCRLLVSFLSAIRDIHELVCRFLP